MGARWRRALAWLVPLPRLRVETTLRGTTRDGTLYVLVHNDGGVTARDATVGVAWVRPGARVLVHRADVGAIEPGGAARVAVKDPQTADVSGAAWVALRVEARARFAMPASAELPVAARRRDAGSDDAPPVSYVRPHAAACPNAPDGRHRFETRGFPNDGVVEQWELCRLCGAVHRLPLTPEQAATQARVRRERAAREAARDEEEYRKAQQGSRARPPPPEPGETLPVSVAFWLLGLDASASWDEVKAAHRKLAKAYHPDAAANADERTRRLMEERMRDVNAAKDRLREHLRPGGEP